MFKAGDSVIYGTQGVCEIIEICKKNMGRQEKEYYVLKPLNQINTKLFVPTDNKNLTERMHAVMSRKEIDELIEAMPQGETLWIEDDVQRREQYRAILSSGDRKKIAAVIKTLYFEKCRRKEIGKKLHTHDEQILSAAEGLLYNELALVLKIAPEQVIPFLMRETSNQVSLTK